MDLAIADYLRARSELHADNGPCALDRFAGATHTLFVNFLDDWHTDDMQMVFRAFRSFRAALAVGESANH
jgi:hypothetical protein